MKYYVVIGSYICAMFDDYDEAVAYINEHDNDAMEIYWERGE